MLRRLQHNRLITIMVNIIIKLTIQHQHGTAHMAKCNMGRRLSLSTWVGGDLSPQLRHYPRWKAHFSGSSSQLSSSLPVRLEPRCLGSSSLTGMARCGVPQFASTTGLAENQQNIVTCLYRLIQGMLHVCKALLALFADMLQGFAICPLRMILFFPPLDAT